MADSPDDLTDPIFGPEAIVQKCFRKAIYHALRMHKLLGNPIATWRDGQVVWIQPEDIVLPPKPEDDEAPTR